MVGTRCPRLLATIREGIANIQALEILDEVTVLKHDLESLVEILATQEPYETVEDAEGDPSIIHNGWFNLYRDAWAIRLWNIGATSL